MFQTSGPDLDFFARRCIWVNGPVIVGAGPSGLAVASGLRGQGVPFVMLERANQILVKSSTSADGLWWPPERIMQRNSCQSLKACRTLVAVLCMLVNTNPVRVIAESVY